MNEYDEIKRQISFAITGRQAITCSNCGKPAVAVTGRKQLIEHRQARHVKTTCRHCKTSYTFVWK